ncbi:MAG: methylated-DNA--[protein]-cysteine S-methyltransferase [Thermoleophilia bacterium]|nr:methylated-DNA--[protein]-cysteine S-methyltransferase [Thermoleophilia bacterium]
MAPIRVSYEVLGWGAGELWFDGDSLLWHELPHGESSRDAADHALAERLIRYFRGEAVSFDDIALASDDEPAFARALAGALRAVPRGAVVTYGELAALAGRPGAARAAGTFCARNRFPIVVPCHRVVAARGLGGYGSLGLDYKRRLLELEGFGPSTR